MTPAAAKRPSLREIATDRTLLLMLGLAYGTGLPFLLVFSTQSARLTEAKVPIETIGLISWVALCYSLKFLWAPVIDRVDVPVLAPLLGRRRAWLLTAQCGVVLGLIGLALGDPARSLPFLIACSLFTAFFGATQDIVVDGWRIDAAPVERQGIMAATYQLGFRLALLSSGAGVFYLAQFYSWRAAYLTMAALMLVGVGAGLASPRLPERPREAGGREALATAYVSGMTRRQLHRLTLVLESTSAAALLLLFVLWRAEAVDAPGAIALFVVAAATLVLPLLLLGDTPGADGRRLAFDRSFVAPVADLVGRYGWWLAVILLLVALYRLPDFLTGVMANPLYISLGFAKVEIANVTKVLGIWVSIAGAFAGGIAIARFGLMAVLLVGGIAAAASHLCLALLAAGGHRHDLLVLAVCVESFAGSFAGTALIAFMSSLVSPAMAASQYALLSSLYALPGKIIGGLSGYAVKEWGFAAFFAASSTLGLPVALLCLAVWAHGRRSAARARPETMAVSGQN